MIKEVGHNLTSYISNPESFGDEELYTITYMFSAVSMRKVGKVFETQIEEQLNDILQSVLDNSEYSVNAENDAILLTDFERLDISTVGTGQYNLRYKLLVHIWRYIGG